MKVKEMIELLLEHGWNKVRHEGSHRQYKKPDNPNVVTVSGKLSDSIPKGTEANILRTAGLK